MWLSPCRGRFCLWRLRIHGIWITASKSLLKQLTQNTKTHWCCVVAHFQHGAVTMSLSLLHIKAANTLIIDNSNHITSKTTYLEDQKSLTLRWFSFSVWGSYRLAFSCAYRGGRYVGYGYQRAKHFPIKLLSRSKIPWGSIDAHYKHVATVVVLWIILYTSSYSHYWQPMYNLCEYSVLSKSFVTSPFLIHWCTWSLRDA